MEANRSYLNVLKGLLIVLVVVGHFGQTIANNLPDNSAFIAQGIVLYIYLFHMPLFLFVSGFLSKNDVKRRKKALEDLFIPYLVFQLFVGVCILLLTKQSDDLLNFFIPQMGAWYLLSLFSYRILLPELKRIRGVIVLSILLTIFTCLMKEVGSEFALNRTLGYFVYFIAGYKMEDLPKNMVRKGIALMGLIVILITTMAITWKTGLYKMILSVLTRGANVSSFHHWYTAPVVYSLALIVTSLMIFLVLNVIPDKCMYFEKQGRDTMPMYLSHLILFMASGYLINKEDWVLTVLLSIVLILFSLFIFSSNWYRSLFNRVHRSIIKALFADEGLGDSNV